MQKYSNGVKSTINMEKVLNNEKKKILGSFKDSYINGEIQCLIELSMKIFGGKWKAQILWILGKKQTLRFGELRKILKKVTPKMLTQQLRELEDMDMVSRREYYQIPPKVEYCLTERGSTIIPILSSICDWCEENIIN